MSIPSIFETAKVDRRKWTKWIYNKSKTKSEHRIRGLDDDGKAAAGKLSCC